MAFLALGISVKRSWVVVLAAMAAALIGCGQSSVGGREASAQRASPSDHYGYAEPLRGIGS